MFLHTLRIFMRFFLIFLRSCAIIEAEKEVDTVDIITNADFSSRISRGELENYIFYGDEDYLKSRAVDSLRSAMEIEDSLAIFNFVKLDVLDYSSERLIDVLSMPPMMADRKLVVLTGLNIKKMSGRSSSELQGLIDALAHLEEFDYNVFVLLVGAGSIVEELPKKPPTGALKQLSEILRPVKFESPTPQKLALWAGRHFSHRGITASVADCAYLIDYCGKDMFTLTGEIEKLCFYARSQSRTELRREDIPLICSQEMEYGAFEFSNAILDGRRADALSILSVMKFRQLEPLIIMGELSGIFSDLLRIKLMLQSGNTPSQIATATGINVHKVNIYAASARGQELSRLIRISQMAAEADLAMKTRFDSGYLQLERLICSL